MPEKKNPGCKCPYNCSRHGDCKACKEYHGRTGSSTNCGARQDEKDKKKKS